MQSKQINNMEREIKRGYKGNNTALVTRYSTFYNTIRHSITVVQHFKKGKKYTEAVKVKAGPTSLQDIFLLTTSSCIYVLLRMLSAR